MSNIYVTSDLHFSHKNILKFNPNTRQYADTDEMNEAIIRHWQNKVMPEDTVYILGDVSFAKLEPTLAILDRLPGQKILIAGNHDERLLQEQSFRDRFVEIHEYLYTKINNTKVVMFHFPIYEWHRMHHGAYHLHGHVHGHKMNVGGRILDVGWDAHGKILSWDEIVKILEPKEIRIHGDGEDNYG